MQKDRRMHRRWTRKTIIQEIIQREAKGLSLSASPRGGVDASLYQAAKRVYGSWQEALLAAGIAPERAMPSERWPPQKILNTIRQLAKRKRPVNIAKISKRYIGLVPAARRAFGSWPKALAAASVDPAKFCCPAPWSRERVIEAILTRALRNELLGSRTTEPRALVDAAQKIFGTWAAAKKAAGVGSCVAAACPTSELSGERRVRKSALPNGDYRPGLAQFSAPLHRPGERWTNELVHASIRARLERGLRLNATAVNDEDKGLYRAATRRFGNWTNALFAAGLNPKDFWRHGKPPSARARQTKALGITDTDDETNRANATPGE
jgi:hypothetical protein